MEQNREPRNKPTQLIFDKVSKNIQQEKDSSSASGIGEAGQLHVNH